MDLLIERWDRQQEIYVPFREERFNVMFAFIAQLQQFGGLPGQLNVLDLACGPGAIGQRLLTRFDDARYVGVDVDPVLLHLAHHAGHRFGDRFRIEARDLADEDWSTNYSDGQFNVVTSSTALHWLDDDSLGRVIGAAARVLAPGGVFLNADNLGFTPPQGTFQRVATALDIAHVSAAENAGGENWTAWWASVRADPELAELCAERDRRFPPKEDAENPPPSLESYEAALRRAGFDEIATIWQHFDDRVLAAVKAA